jgi:hypothetical protein
METPDTAFVAIDTEWGLNRWGYGPDGHHITEFGAADAQDAVLVTDLQPLPSAGPEREEDKKKKELRLLGHGMEWVIARCPDCRSLHQYISGGGYLDGSYLGADMTCMKGVVLTARAYGVGESTISKSTNLGGANNA